MYVLGPWITYYGLRTWHRDNLVNTMGASLGRTKSSLVSLYPLIGLSKNALFHPWVVNPGLLMKLESYVWLLFFLCCLFIMLYVKTVVLNEKRDVAIIWSNKNFIVWSQSNFSEGILFRAIFIIWEENHPLNAYVFSTDVCQLLISDIRLDNRTFSDIEKFDHQVIANLPLECEFISKISSKQFGFFEKNIWVLLKKTCILFKIAKVAN